MDQWAARHGLDPGGSAWVTGWARLTHACARPLARSRTTPDAVTVSAVGVTAAAVGVAAAGAAWPLLATVLVVLAAVLDGVDGALASQTGTATRWGQVFDPLADRCSDLLLLVTLGVLGAPWWLVSLAGATTLLLESVRSSAQVAGMHGPGAITVWERPSRVIVTAFATALAALAWVLARVAGWSGGLAADVAGVAAGVAVALSLVGLVQLLRAVRRALRGP